jgi:hypothetical protein
MSRRQSSLRPLSRLLFNEIEAAAVGLHCEEATAARGSDCSRLHHEEATAARGSDSSRLQEGFNKYENCFF